MMHKLSLRMRITLLVGLIIVAIAVLLTVVSIRSATNYFVGEQMNRVIMDSPEGVQLQTNPDETIDNLAVDIRVMDAKKKFSTQSIIVMFVIIFVGIGGTYIIVGRALKPLSDLSKTIKDMNERNLSKRVPVPNVTDEIGSLSVSFNAMLDRLDHSFTQQKRFAANAAHELKTPLATIKTSLQVLHLDEYPTSEDYRVNAVATAQSTERLIRVVDDLLQFSVEDRGDFHDKVSIKALYKDIVQELEPLAKERGVRMEIGQCEGQLLGNKTLLYRALFNVVANAVKYNKQDGRVVLSARKDNDLVVMTIHDQGIGIPEDEVGNIFEPFYRIEKSRSRETAGSGLGLALVKTIMDHHGGTIDVTSKEDVGTIIELTVPARNSKE